MVDEVARRLTEREREVLSFILDVRPTEPEDQRLIDRLRGQLEDVAKTETLSGDTRPFVYDAYGNLTSRPIDHATGAPPRRRAMTSRITC